MVKPIYLLLIFVFSCQRPTDIRNIELQDTNCNKRDNKTADCNCIKSVVVGKQDLYLIKTFKETDPVSEQSYYCRQLRLSINDQIISLDSIYYSSIRNKKIPYLPGFISGTLKEDDKKIEVNMQFINGGINTSRSTLHEFFIKYVKVSKRIEKIDLTFIKDQTAVPD